MYGKMHRDLLCVYGEITMKTVTNLFCIGGISIIKTEAIPGHLEVETD